MSELEALTDTLDALYHTLRECEFQIPGFEQWRRRRDQLIADVDVLGSNVANPSRPLVIVIGGATGTGKSTLLNSLARTAISPTGMFRPTTLAPVIWGSDQARPPWDEFVRASGGDLLHLVDMVDGTDFDSTVRGHRDQAERLARAADVCVFVTSAKRYSDHAAWEMLLLMKRLGTPLYLVLNRLTGEEDERIVADYAGALGRGGLMPQVARPRMLLIREQPVVSERLPAVVVEPLRRFLEGLSRPGPRRRLLEQAYALRVRRLALDVDELARALLDEAALGSRLAGAALAAFGIAAQEVGASAGSGHRRVEVASVAAQAAAATRVAWSSLPAGASLARSMPLVQIDLRAAGSVDEEEVDVVISQIHQEWSRYEEFDVEMGRQRSVVGRLRALADSLREVGPDA